MGNKKEEKPATFVTGQAGWLRRTKVAAWASLLVVLGGTLAFVAVTFDANIDRAGFLLFLSPFWLPYGYVAWQLHAGKLKQGLAAAVGIGSPAFLLFVVALVLGMLVEPDLMASPIRLSQSAALNSSSTSKAVRIAATVSAAFYQGNLRFYAGYLALNEVTLEFEGATVGSGGEASHEVTWVRPDSLALVGRMSLHKSQGHPRQSMPCNSRVAPVHPTIALPDQH